MDENMNTAVPQEPEELELDLRDMLATLLLRWKTLLICLLAGAMIFGLLTLRSSPRTKTVSFVSEADVHAARQAVSEDRADAIELLYERIQFFTDYQRSIERSYSRLAGSNRELENAVILQESFCVISGIDNIGSYFSSTLLSEEDYDSLREVAPDSEIFADIHDRVEFSTDSLPNTLNLLDNDDGQLVLSIINGGSGKELFTVTVYATSELECRDMVAAVENVLQRKADALRAVDAGLKLEPVGSRVSYDARSFIQARQDELWLRYSGVDEQLTEQQEKVWSLTGAEKTYYQKLEQLNKGDTTVSSGGRSLKKWTAIGSIVGLTAGVILVIWSYLFDGKVKTAGELEYSLRSMVLNRVCVMGKRNLFGRWAVKLTGSDMVDPGIKADMVATDLGILMEKNGKKAVYLLCCADDIDTAAFAEQVRVRVLEKAPDADITVGNPLSSAEQLEKIGTAELSVVFAEIKKTKRALLRQWMQVCARYRIPVAGSVAVEKCW